MLYFLELIAQRLADLWFQLAPRRQPTLQALLNCKIISHRGEHDNRQVRENTMTAFTRVAEAGIWGIELDVRWTRDLQPVVIHDPRTARVFGIDLEIATASLSELRLQIPEIPTLQEVVDCFGGKTHLMIELKDDELGQHAVRMKRLQEIFSGLQPGVDYHFLALQLVLFQLVEFAGAKACLPVAELNVRQLSRQILASNMAGICGQYLLIHHGLVQRHHRQGQKLGTGFATSRFCLYRELNREVDWIFTNHALRLKAVRDDLLNRRN